MLFYPICFQPAYLSFVSYETRFQNTDSVYTDENRINYTHIRKKQIVMIPYQ